MDELISRQAAIDAFDCTNELIVGGEANARNVVNYINKVVGKIKDLPAAQPERLTDYSFEESCTDCPAYDTENHRCPRFNQVIRVALKDANLEPCEDCISRQAAIDALADMHCKSDEDGYVWIIRSDAWARIDALPSVTPKRKTGKWIKLDMHAHLADHKCSVCEQECYVPTCMGEPMYDFCPHCGARMTKEDV